MSAETSKKPFLLYLCCYDCDLQAKQPALLESAAVSFIKAIYHNPDRQYRPNTLNTNEA